MGSVPTVPTCPNLKIGGLGRPKRPYWRAFLGMSQLSQPLTPTHVRAHIYIFLFSSGRLGQKKEDIEIARFFVSQPTKKQVGTCQDGWDSATSASFIASENENEQSPENLPRQG